MEKRPKLRTYTLKSEMYIYELKKRFKKAVVAQSAERTTLNRVVVGSSPTNGGIFFAKIGDVR